MIKCKECNKEVSSEAKTCPHCGIQIKLDLIGQVNQLISKDKKKILKIISYILYALSVIDFCFGNFFNIDLTGVSWSPIAFVILGFFASKAGVYLFKPESLSQALDGTIEKSVSLYEGFTNNEGKLYVSTDKIIFDGENIDIVEITYDKIKRVTKAKAIFVFPGVLLTLKGDKEYLFGMLTGRDMLFNAIQTNLNKSLKTFDN